MKEVIEKVAADAGISPDQASIAVQSVSQYIKDKTPHVLHDQFDILLNGGTLSDGMKKKMKDLRDELEEAAQNLGHKAEDLAEGIGKTINNVFGKK